MMPADPDDQPQDEPRFATSKRLALDSERYRNRGGCQGALVNGSCCRRTGTVRITATLIANIDGAGNRIHCYWYTLREVIKEHGDEPVDEPVWVETTHSAYLLFQESTCHISTNCSSIGHCQRISGLYQPIPALRPRIGLTP